jgi:hypothetical protein
MKIKMRNPNNSDMKDGYDFSGDVRGKHADRDREPPCRTMQYTGPRCAVPTLLVIKGHPFPFILIQNGQIHYVQIPLASL